VASKILRYADQEIVEEYGRQPMKRLCEYDQVVFDAKESDR
jgi:hypothetical protein